MKLCSFDISGVNRIGVQMPDGRVADCNYTYASYLKAQGSVKAQQMADVVVPPDMIGMIESGEHGKEQLRLAMGYLEAAPNAVGPCGEKLLYGCDEIHFRAPVTNPEKIFCTAINNKFEYERCIKPEGVPPHPLYFSKYNSCLCGAYDEVQIPDIGVVGTEVEMAFIIGKSGKFVPESEARDYIYGFTIHNDLTCFTLRINSEWIVCVNGEGQQEKVMYPGRYKCFDTFGPMGPWLVTVDELPIDEAFQQKMTASLDDLMVQDGTTDEILFRVDYLIPYLSKAHTLKAGDIVSTGTVISYAGAEFDNIDLRSNSGKVLHSSIERIGEMRNPIRAI